MALWHARALVASLCLLALPTVAMGAAPPAAGGGAVSRGAMALAVVWALDLAPTRLGPAYADVSPQNPYFAAVEAGADAGLWPPWHPGAAFRPGAPATVGDALHALVNGLSGARVAADLPDGLRLAARALGLWPTPAPALDAPLTRARLDWLSARARAASPGALEPLEARLVRGVTWLDSPAVAAGSLTGVEAVAVDRAGYALPVPLSVRASAGVANSAQGVYRAPARAGVVTLTAVGPAGVVGRTRLTVAGPLTLALEAPSVLPASRTDVVEAAVEADGTVFAGDSGRSIALAVERDGRTAVLQASDDFGLAPFPLPPLAPGPVRLTLSAQGLGSRTYRLRVGGARRPGGLSLSPAAPPPARLTGATNPFAGKGMWLPYWIYQAVPLGRLMAEARTSGVRTIYLEVAASGAGFYGRRGLARVLAAASRQGIRVVAWIYADLADPAEDMGNLGAVEAFRTASGERPAGVALDLEGNVALPVWALRDELALARRLAGPAGPVLAVTYPAGPLAPPYGLIARYASAIGPMDYWHGRLQGMGYNAAYDQVAESIAAIRAAAPGEPVSVIAQTFDLFTASGEGAYNPTAAELSGALAAARAGGAEGVSFYQWGTVSAAEWPVVALPWPP